MAEDIQVDVSDLLPEFAKLIQAGYGDTVFAHTRNALGHIAEMYQKVWRGYATGTPIPGAPRVISSASYARSIQVDNSDPDVKIVYTDNDKYHGLIENGRPRYDMKPGLLSGPNARTTKDGGKYNIIPFRHQTPGGSRNPMPVNVYRTMLRESDRAELKKQMGISSTGGKSHTLSSGPTPAQRSYQWGARLSKYENTQTPLHPKKKHWKSPSVFSGMVRMQASTTGANRSKYMTFRVVSSRSDPDSWISPKLDPIPIRKRVVETVNPIAVQMLQAAIEGDIR